MSDFTLGNLFLGLSLLLGSASQVMLKMLLGQLGPTLSWATLLRVVERPTCFRLAGIIVLIGGAFLAWSFALTKLNLSYAYPIACGSAFFVTLLSALFLGELVTSRMWLGTLLIIAGTILLMPAK